MSYWLGCTFPWVSNFFFWLCFCFFFEWNPVLKSCSLIMLCHSIGSDGSVLTYPVSLWLWSLPLYEAVNHGINSDTVHIEELHCSWTMVLYRTTWWLFVIYLDVDCFGLALLMPLFSLLYICRSLSSFLLPLALQICLHLYCKFYLFHFDHNYLFALGGEYIFRWNYLSFFSSLIFLLFGNGTNKMMFILFSSLGILINGGWFLLNVTCYFKA